MKSRIDFEKSINKVVTFSKEFDDELGEIVGFEEGMKARIKGIVCDGYGEYVVYFDFSEFEEYNKKLMKSDYYDKNGIPCLRWDQTSYYPKDLTEEVYFVEGTDYSHYFSLIE